MKGNGNKTNDTTKLDKSIVHLSFIIITSMVVLIKISGTPESGDEHDDHRSHKMALLKVRNFVKI